MLFGASNPCSDNQCFLTAPGAIKPEKQKGRKLTNVNALQCEILKSEFTSPDASIRHLHLENGKKNFALSPASDTVCVEPPSEEGWMDRYHLLIHPPTSDFIQSASKPQERDRRTDLIIHASYSSTADFLFIHPHLPTNELVHAYGRKL